jgi:hypothetical protein
LNLDNETLDRMARAVWNRRELMGYETNWHYYDVVWGNDGGDQTVRVYLKGRLVFVRADSGDTGNAEDLPKSTLTRVNNLWRRIAKGKELGKMPICARVRNDGGLCHGRPLPPDGRCKRHFGGWRHSKGITRFVPDMTEVTTTIVTLRVPGKRELDLQPSLAKAFNPPLTDDEFQMMKSGVRATVRTIHV